MVAHEVEREVFEACRSIFTGQNAHLRRPRKITQALQRNRAKIHLLLQRYNLDTLTEIVRILLEKKVFELKARAQARFPELYLPEVFETNVALETQHIPLDGAAVRADTEVVTELNPEPVIDDVSLLFSDEEDEDSQHGGDDYENEVLEENDAVDQGPSLPTAQKEAVETSAGPDMHADSPVYLPYQTQHRILTATQAMLEQTCFTFAQRHLPEVLAAKNWDCAEAVELTQWIRILRKNWQKLQGMTASTTAITTTTITISEESSLANSNPGTILRHLRTLRNRAVHREPTPSPTLHILVASAAALAAYLHDGPLASQLNRAAEALEIVTKDTQAKRAVRKAKLDAELRSVEAQRAELDRRERAAFDAFEEGEGKAVVENGAWLDRRVEATFLGSDELELGKCDNGGEDEDRCDGKGKDASSTGTRNSVLGVMQSLVGFAFAQRV